MSTYLLIHGAFHGGWCWRDVAKPLRSAGHTVLAPSLTGLGDRAHLLSSSVTLDTHIEDICGVIGAHELDDIVLVAHSYGGMPATGAADRCHAQIRRLVYLDAIVPESGDTGQSVRGPSAARILERPADGLGVPPPPTGFFGVSGENAAWVERRMTPHPYATTTQPIALSGAWQRIPAKLFVRTRAYPAAYLDRYFADAQARPEWEAIECDESHDMMIMNPDFVVGLLLGEAASRRGE